MGRASVSFEGALVGLDTRLNSLTLPSARTHPSRVAQDKKKISAFTFLSNRRCACIHSRTHSPRAHRCGMFHRDCTAAPAAQRHVAPRPSVAAACLPVPPSPLTTRRRVLRGGVAWSTATALAPRSSPHPAACLPPSSLSIAPERPLLATAAPHQVGHGCRRRHVFVSTVFQKLFSSVSSVCCVCCNGYIRMLQVYVSNISIV